jgi:hypothetical protein
MDIKPIKTDADYRAALEEIETLMAAEPDSSEGEKPEVLATPRSLHKKRFIAPPFTHTTVAGSNGATPSRKSVSACSWRCTRKQNNCPLRSPFS